MLRIKPVTEFKTEVSCVMADGTTATFVATYKEIDQAEFDRVQEDLRKGRKSNEDVVNDYLLDLGDILDESGQPVDFAPARDYILRTPRLLAATSAAFVTGVLGAREGNSKRSRAR